MRASDRRLHDLASQPFPTLCREVGKRCALISLGVPNLPSLPKVRRVCAGVRAHTHARSRTCENKRNAGKVGKVGKYQQRQGFRLPTLCLRLGKGWEVLKGVAMASVAELRSHFVRLARWRCSQGEWSAADKAEASESIRLAIDSGSDSRINEALVWLQAELVGVDAMAGAVRSAQARIRAVIEAERVVRDGDGSARRQAAPVQALPGVVVRNGPRDMGGAANGARGAAGVGAVHGNRRRA